MPLARWRSSIWAGGCPTALATQPGRFSGPLHPFPIRSCSGWGLPSRPVTRPLVRSYRTVASLPARRPAVFISVALALRSPSLDVIQHPALWSPDFPRPPQSAAAIAFPTHSQTLQALLFGFIGYHTGAGWSNPDHRTDHFVETPTGAFFFTSFHILLQHCIQFIGIVHDHSLSRRATNRRSFVTATMV